MTMKGVDRFCSERARSFTTATISDFALHIILRPPQQVRSAVRWESAGGIELTLQLRRFPRLVSMDSLGLASERRHTDVSGTGAFGSCLVLRLELDRSDQSRRFLAVCVACTLSMREMLAMK